MNDELPDMLLDGCASHNKIVEKIQAGQNLTI
jgi:hypothetical protein